MVSKWFMLANSNISRNRDFHRYKVTQCDIMVIALWYHGEKTHRNFCYTCVNRCAEQKNLIECQRCDSVRGISPSGLRWWYKLGSIFWFSRSFIVDAFWSCVPNRVSLSFYSFKAADGEDLSPFPCAMAQACPEEGSEMCAHWLSCHPRRHNSQARL